MSELKEHIVRINKNRRSWIERDSERSCDFFGEDIQNWIKRGIQTVEDFDKLQAQIAWQELSGRKIHVDSRD